jgi:hypothetical protein
MPATTLEHDAGDHAAVVGVGEGDGEVGDAAEEVGGAVERVDDEARAGAGAALLALLGLEARAGIEGGERRLDGRLRSQVGLGDEVGRALLGDRERGELGEAVEQHAGACAGGPDHRLDER